MRAIVTGVTGFIGSELASKLLDNGHEVNGLVRHVVSRQFESIAGIRDRINLHTCDIRDLSSVRNTIEDTCPDIIFHLAALSPVRLSFENPLDFQDSNYLGSVNIAQSLMDLDRGRDTRLVVASTAEVYGIQEQTKPFTEELPLKPSSPYAVSKAAMDMYMRMLSEVYDFNVVILRNSNTFGRKHDPSFFTEYLITQMFSGKDIYIGAPESVRDYMYVDDHVNSYFLTINNQDAEGQAINIAGGRGFTNKQWAFKIADLIGFPKDRIHLGEYPPGYPERPISSDQPYLVLNPAKAGKILGWSQSVTPEEGLAKTINYWKSK